MHGLLESGPARRARLRSGLRGERLAPWPAEAEAAAHAGEGLQGAMNDYGCGGMSVMYEWSAQPFKYYKEIPSLPSNIKKECSHSLLILQGNALTPF